MSNSFGKIFKITTFGESHGKGIGVVIDGCPAGLIIDMDFVQYELDRRKPGQSAIVTQRKETDKVECLSGVWQGQSTGTPIALWIANQDAKSQDYSEFADKFRPSHADYTYFAKYGLRDYRGGGRSSARETASRVAGGAIAKLFLQQYNTKICAYTSQVGNIILNKNYQEIDISLIEQNPVRCPDVLLAQEMENLIREVRKDGDTIGGVITAFVQNVDVGLGEPVFDRLHAQLGKAMLSLPACKGFAYGSGFEGVSMRGSQHNDIFYKNENNTIKTHSNHSGGIQGGISNGEDIYFRTAFKPVATIMQNQNTLNEQGENTTIQGKGRHDPCVVPRAVPMVEAMTALVLADFYLRKRNDRI
jgi:chorismate synthase